MLSKGWEVGQRDLGGGRSGVDGMRIASTELAGGALGRFPVVWLLRGVGRCWKDLRGGRCWGYVW